MILFWVVAGVLAAGAAGLILIRAARAASEAQAPDPTPILYRRALSEIDDLAERGLIGEAERKTAHAEAARRLLTAVEHPDRAWTPGPRADRAVLISVLVAPALGLGLYLLLGAPGFPDQPFERRVAAWKKTDIERLRPDELAAVLSDLARTRPKDAELQRYIGLAQSAAQNPAESVRALRKAVELAPERADLWTTLGEALVSRDGQVSGEAEDAFRESLKRDPTGASPRFYVGQAQIMRGDKTGGLAQWRGVLADLAPNDPRRTLLIQEIAKVEAQPEKPTFSSDQMAAIRGMVAGLAERLKTNPDDAEGWVRLVRAYAVLGEASQRDAALKAARTRYAGRPEVLSQLDQAAAAEPMK